MYLMKKTSILLSGLILFSLVFILIIPSNAGSNNWEFPTTPIQLTNWQSSHATDPDLTVSASGNIHFVFRANDTTNMETWYAYCFTFRSARANPACCDDMLSGSGQEQNLKEGEK